MKKAFLFIALIAPILAHAQRPIQGSKSFTFGLSGLQNIGLSTSASRTGTILYRKYKTDTMAHRLSAQLGLSASRTSLDNPDMGNRTITLNNTGTISTALGFQKSLGGSAKLEPYWGVDFLLGYTYLNKLIIRTEITNPDKTIFDSTDEVGDYQETETRQGKPVRAGILPLIGVNYFITDGISLGAEFSYGLFTQIAGNGTSTSRSRIAGVDQEAKTVNVTSTVASVFLGGMGSGLVNLSIYF